jgi:hypothetical protein
MMHLDGIDGRNDKSLILRDNKHVKGRPPNAHNGRRRADLNLAFLVRESSSDYKSAHSPTELQGGFPQALLRDDDELRYGHLALFPKIDKGIVPEEYLDAPSHSGLKDILGEDVLLKVHRLPSGPGRTIDLDRTDSREHYSHGFRRQCRGGDQPHYERGDA